MDTPQPVTLTAKQFQHLLGLASRVEHLQHQVDGLASQDTSAATPTSSASSSARPPKINTPEPFHGQRNKLRAFLSQVDIYINTRLSQFPTDRYKVLFAASFLRSAAFLWFEPHLRSQHKESPSALLDDFEAFTDALHQAYGEIDEVAVAERRLLKLKQAGSTSQYASEFQQITSHLRWDQQALCFHFYNGLKDAIKDELAKEDRPEMLGDLVRKAVKIDNRLFERRQEKGNFVGGRTSSQIHTPFKSRQGTSSAPYYGPQPMELDATQGEPPQKKFSKLTAAERSYRRTHNLCLYCGKAGHMVNKCYLAKNKASINVSMTLDANGNACKPTNPGSKNETSSRRDKSKN